MPAAEPSELIDHAGLDHDRPRLRTVLTGLCVTEIISWGVLYYAFPVLAPTITADTGWPTTWTTAAFSAALVVAALVGIPVGRILDRRGPRMIMTAGSVLAVAAVLLIAWSPHILVFAAGWLLAGTAMAGVLYQPAFAALTRWYGPRRLQAVTVVTLVAGLASTVFAPLTDALNAQLHWRGVYLVLALLLAGVTIPVQLLTLRRAWPAEQHGGPSRSAGTDRSYATMIIRSRTFVLLAIGLTAASLAMYAVVINLVPLLIERGLSPTTAAWALGLGGVGQVAGRLLYALLVTRLGLRSRTMIIFGIGALTTAAFAVVPGPVGLLITIAIAAGFARGIATLLQATAVPDRWGPRSYGRISGILAAPVTLISAVAPWVGAGIAAIAGYRTMFSCLAALATVATAVIAVSTPSSRRRRSAGRSGT